MEDVGIPIEVVSEETAVEVIGEDAEMMSGNSERRKNARRRIGSLTRLPPLSQARMLSKYVKNVSRMNATARKRRKKSMRKFCRVTFLT